VDGLRCVLAYSGLKMAWLQLEFRKTCDRNSYTSNHTAIIKSHKIKDPVNDNSVLSIADKTQHMCVLERFVWHVGVLEVIGSAFISLDVNNRRKQQLPAKSNKFLTTQKWKLRYSQSLQLPNISRRISAQAPLPAAVKLTPLNTQHPFPPVLFPQWIKGPSNYTIAP